METLFNHYPLYKADQFLTSENLNDSFNYLEQQERFTRSHFSGQGIIKGLNFTQVETAGKISSININAGWGETRNGYFVSVPGYTNNSYPLKTYTHQRSWAVPTYILTGSGNPETKTTCILLLTSSEAASDEHKNEATPISFAPSDLNTYCLVLYCDIADKTITQCTPTDCNLQGTERTIRSLPLLIPKSNFPIINTYYSPLSPILIQRISNISSIDSQNIYKTKINGLISTNLAIISSALQSIYNASHQMFPLDESIATQGVTRIRQIPLDTNSALNQYYLLFIKDMQQAVNEFINSYNNSIKKYYHTDNTRKDQLLVLGQFPFTENDPYRYHFTSPISSRDRLSFYTVLGQLYRRLFILPVKFMEPSILNVRLQTGYGNTAISRIKIIPDKMPDTLLGNKSIPYYYDIYKVADTDPLFKHWHAHELDTNTGTNFNYFDDQSVSRKHLKDPFLYNIDSYPLFRIEGHLGLPVKEAYNQIVKLVQQFDIPVLILKVDVTDTKWNDFRNKYIDFANKYKLAIEDMKKANITQNKEIYLSYIKQFDNFKNEVFSTSYRDVEAVNKALNDINAQGTMYVKAANSNMRDTSSGPDKLLSAEIKKALDKYQILELKKDVIKYVPPKEKNELSLREIDGLEYQGGVYKGGTFFLIHNNTSVIGDFSIPYFFKKQGIIYLSD